MSIDTTSLPLEITDALEQIIISPDGRHLWRRLNIAFSKISNDAHRLWVKNIIVDHTPDLGVAGFFRATFLAYTCGDRHFLPIASSNLLLNSISQVDKVMTYINYEIGKTMSSPINRSSFQNTLQQNKIPELIRGLANYFLKLIPPLSHKPINRHVAIYASNICSAVHPPTKLVLQHACLLHDLGYTVQIFCAQEEKINYAEEYLGNGGVCISKPFDPREFSDYLGSRKISFSFASTDHSLQTRWKSITHSIKDFQAELIFFIGMQSPLVEALYQYCPVLALSTTSAPPIGSCDLWLSALNAPSTQVWGDTFSLGPSHFYPYRVERKSLKNTTNRQQLNLKKDHIVLISVGARLKSEIHGAWAQQIKTLLKQHPTSIWLLVGGDGKLPEALEDMPKQQIRCIPYTPDLIAIYRCCDIYLNPPRLGGGFSVAEAMAEGLSVVSFEDCDGGNKLGDYAVNNLDEYLLRVQKLITNRAHRKELGKKMAEIFSTSIDLHQARPTLESAIKQCLIHFSQRNSVSR